MRAYHACPPENGAEEAIVIFLLDEGSARHIEIEIRVPSLNFTRLRIVRISQNARR